MPVDDLQQYGLTKAREIRERRERRKVAEEKASIDKKLKAVWAPKIWEQTRETIRELVDSVNDALGEPSLECDDGRARIVTIRVARVASNLSASYNAATGSITLALDDHSEAFNLEVVKGEVKLKAVGYFTPQQVAKMLVDKAASMVL